MAITGIDNSYLLALWGQSSTNVSLTGLAASSTTPAATPAKKVAPTAPWTQTTTPDQASAAVKSVLAGNGFIDEDAAKLDLTGASDDYKKLFALYKGLSTLSDVASRMEAKGILNLEKARVTTAFEKGMAEVQAYIQSAEFEQLRLKQGEAASLTKSTVAVPKDITSYQTPPLTSSTAEEVAAFQGDVSFYIKIKRVGVEHDIAVDLSDMGSQPRTLGNVINFINAKLADEGVATRLATVRIPGVPRTTTVGGKSVSLGTGPDQWAMNVKIGTSETVTFGATATAPAIYVAQAVGDPDPDHKASTADGRVEQQFLKFQTDDAAVPPPLQGAGEANWVEGRVFAETLGPEVKTVHATQVGPDGAVYMLADITGKTDGQDIKGEQDVALLKYDSAGKLIYARTLGAAGSATGLGLAVSATGEIAVAGSLTGGLSGATDGALNSGTLEMYAANTDSFVTLYNGDGEEQWTQRRGARKNDEASQVAFGADGAVYVTGRTQSALPGTEAIGDWDSYIEGFKADAAGKVQTLFSQTFGTAGSDRPEGLVVDGTSLVTASIEDGHAILRRFDISGGAPVLTATRDIGDLQNGDIAGLAIDGGRIVLAGSTTNASLSAGAVSRAHAGGMDAFALSLSANLAPAASDRLAYYGGEGEDRATSLAVSGGKVFIGGMAGTDLPDQDPMGKKDAFLANLNLTSGAVDWSRRFSGKDGFAAPTAIAVDPGGASVLDRLGLPKGTIDVSDSQRITAQSSVRAGDTFTVRSGDGAWKTVTLEEKDTLDTLAQKIRRAAGYQAKVTITTSNGAKQLQIAPLNDRMILEIGPGQGDKNALEMLGIPEGVLRNTRLVDGKAVPTDGKAKLYGLGLPSDLNLSSTEQIKHTLAEIAAAMGVLRTAYKDMTSTSSEPTLEERIQAQGGKAPAYLTNQIANYQAALSRLTGG
ncbi:MAG: hypothetical protein ABW360_12470 [Phenylobacterium sp.]